ncbi:MAG TPA: tetratricopeptide repeat protein [Xanthomonadales bacterium]|nr:tetratricopeptide repeat protein [Xanthomonadales bacterium]
MSLFEELKRRNVIRVAIAYGVVSWLVVQVAEIATDSFEAPAWVIKTFITFLALGFPFALIFAWAYELTPEGLKKEKDVDRTQSITHHTGRKLDRTIMIIMALALGYFAWDKFSATDVPVPADATNQVAESKDVGNPEKASETEQRSIAVLPFVDMSPAKDNEYFTDGLTEELLNILAQIKSLQVAGRTSSFAFKNQTDDLREIGSKLNVNTLLEGSVRKDDKNQRIRVTVQLINVEDGYHIWSDTYDRDLEDIFAIQEDIARQVADALKINLLGEEEARIAGHAETGMSAYDLYLQGLQSLNVYSFESLRAAEQLFTQSLALDPDYLPTKLALTRSLLNQADTGAIPLPEAVSRANTLLDEILAVDPGNSDAHTYRGMIKEYDSQFEQARESFELALESNPRNANALMRYGRFLFDRYQLDEGMSYLRQAAKIEPYDVAVQWELCITQAFIQDVPAATRECDRIGEIQPGSPMQYYGKSYLYSFRGELAQALYWHAKSIEADPADPELPAGFALAWLDLGDLEQAEIMLQKAASLEPDHPFVQAARIEFLIEQEQYQQALDLARKAYDDDLPDRQGSRFIINRLLVNDAVKRKDYDQALGILAEDFPEGIESPLDTRDASTADLLASIAYVIKLKDPASDEVGAILDHAEELNALRDERRLPQDKAFNQAMIEVTRGNKPSAIASLQDSFEKGWRWGWRDVMFRDFQFESLHQEPEFKQLIAQFEADMEKQRAEAYELLGLPQ